MRANPTASVLDGVPSATDHDRTVVQRRVPYDSAPSHDNRAVRVRDEHVGNGAEEQAAEAAQPSGADDHQSGVLRLRYDFLAGPAGA